MIHYQTKTSLKLHTSQGIVELGPGRVISLADEKEAIRLINERKITPIDPDRWKIFSEILQDHLWVVPALEDAADLIAQGVEEPIYTEEEVDWERGASRETKRAVHQVKKAFPGSRVEYRGEEKA